MTPSVLLAAMAGALGAGAVLEVAALAGARSAASQRRPLLAVLRRLGRAAGVPTPPRDLPARLAAAGLAGRVDAGDVMAVKLGAALAAALLVPGLAAAAPGRLGLVLVALPAGAFLAPDVALRRRARRRSRQLAAELPAALELLQVAVAAGLPPRRAVAEVGRRCDGVLAHALAAAAAKAELGLPWEAALDDLEACCVAPGVPALAAALRRAHRHGAPAGPVLAALAADARARRAAEVREHAARAAPQIQLVVALLLVPAVLLLLGAALVPALL